MSNSVLAASILCCALAGCGAKSGPSSASQPPAPDLGGGVEPSPVPVTPPPPSAPPTVAINPIRVAAGASAAYTDSSGNTWAADTGFSGGIAFTQSPAISISGTATPQLYNGERYGADTNGKPATFSYGFDLPAGSYTVTLKFAEAFASAVGQRQFNVAINGNPVLSNFDIYAAAGGMNAAVDKAFPVTLNAAGTLKIELSPGAAQNPKIDAIEVVTQGAPSPTPPPSSGPPPIVPPIDGATPGTWQENTINGMPYALLMPARYDGSHSYPLLLYLHQLANEASIPQQCDPWLNSAAFRSRHPAIVVAPKCVGSSAQYNWGGVDAGAQPCQNNAMALVKQLMQTYPVDARRVYVTGNSMGGLGSWDIIIKYTSMFAAAMPLAGANYYQDVNGSAQALKSVPIWSIHGAQDGQVPLAWDRNIYAAISALKGIEKYSELAALGHDVWDTVYPDMTYWDWLFAQAR